MKSKEFIQGLIEYLKNNLNIPDANFLKIGLNLKKENMFMVKYPLAILVLSRGSYFTYMHTILKWEIFSPKMFLLMINRQIHMT